MKQEDESWMQLALDQANTAAICDEVPVGAVVVYQRRVVGSGYNQPIGSLRPTAHAEILALEEAAQTMRNYRLPGCTLYVTLEPCIMCVGAMLQARISRLVFAASEPKTGAVCSCYHLLDNPDNQHQIDWRSGVLAESSSGILRRFFQNKRR